MIRLGLLDCGELPAEIIEKHGTFAQWFEQFLSMTSTTIKFRSYSAWDRQLPVSVDACDACLITGSADSVYEGLEWLNELKSFIQMAVPKSTICWYLFWPSTVA